MSDTTESNEKERIWMFEHFDIFIDVSIVSLLIVRHTYNSIKKRKSFLSQAHELFSFSFFQRNITRYSMFLFAILIQESLVL
jgi:hypothetical protein